MEPPHRVSPLAILLAAMAACGSETLGAAPSPADTVSSAAAGSEPGTGAGSPGGPLEPRCGLPGCAGCCDAKEPVAPPGAVSFHVIDIGFPVYWDSILELVQSHPTVMLASQNKPDAIGYDRWVAMVHTSHAPSGADMAELVDELLSDEATSPRIVMLDELNDGTVDYVRDFASAMRTKHPRWQGRWGSYTTIFTGGLAAIDELLLSHAYIAVERYIEQSWYCAQGATGGARDEALATFFDGNATLARYHWLVERKAAKNSESHLSVVFGVTDRFLDGASPAIYLDRMFYVWATRTAHSEAIAIAEGGAGSWKWDQTEPGSIGVSNTSRDLAFAESIDWYSVQGKTTSRLGPVPCP